MQVHTVEGGDHKLRVKGGAAANEALAVSLCDAAVAFLRAHAPLCENVATRAARISGLCSQPLVFPANATTSDNKSRGQDVAAAGGSGTSMVAGKRRSRVGSSAGGATSADDKGAQPGKKVASATVSRPVAKQSQRRNKAPRN